MPEVENANYNDLVGSIKFVGGMRKDVLAKLAEKIAACRVDEPAQGG